MYQCFVMYYTLWEPPHPSLPIASIPGKNILVIFAAFCALLKTDVTVKKLKHFRNVFFFKGGVGGWSLLESYIFNVIICWQSKNRPP